VFFKWASLQGLPDSKIDKLGTLNDLTKGPFDMNTNGGHDGIKHCHEWCEGPTSIQNRICRGLLRASAVDLVAVKLKPPISIY
jgi:hypothetical protein